jgi:hypothetical protein
LSGSIAGGVIKTHPGIITCTGPPIYVLPDVSGHCTVTASAIPTATDNCSGLITATTTDLLSYTTAGVHTVSWNFDDGNGNVLTQTQNFIVNSIDTSVTVSGSTLTSNAVGVNYQWYDCYSNSLINGQTGQEYNDTISGSYAVIVSQAGCGTDTSSCYEVLILGIEQLSNDFDISIFPNPSSGVFSIDMNTVLAERIYIHDVLGQLLFTEKPKSNAFTVDLSEYNNGIFFITIETTRGSKTIKAIKN